MPQPGDIVHIGAACGVPFNIRPIYLRFTRVITYTGSYQWPGMAWLDGYELDTHLQAVARREVYVITDGLLIMPKPAPVVRRPVNTGPIVPRQRTATTPTTVGRNR
jgi:hypothetical protein